MLLMSLNQLDHLQYKQDKVFNVQSITDHVLLSGLQNMFLRPAGFISEQHLGLSNTSKSIPVLSSNCSRFKSESASVLCRISKIVLSFISSSHLFICQSQFTILWCKRWNRKDLKKHRSLPMGIPQLFFFFFTLDEEHAFMIAFIFFQW